LADLSFANAVAIPCIEGEVLATSGQGGDQIFARRPSLDSAGDAIRDGLPLSEIWRILEDNARASGKPLTRILKETWRGLTMRQAQYLVQAWGDAVDAGDEVNGAMIQHPWLRDALCGPSRAQRILNLVDLPYYHAPNVLSARYPTVPVIASQPIVETALSIAPYVMQQGGGDRALARAAFADVLPNAQLQRTRKGDATRYFAAVVDANLNFMRDILCDGELVRRRLVDSEVIAADLARPLQGGAIYRLTDAMVAEIWIRRVETLRNAEA
jgi:asparagine synthase (glutamine-hydrolysing)